jgi:hypothetical protein
MVAVIRRCGGPEISGVKTVGNGDCNEPMMAGKLGVGTASAIHIPPRFPSQRSSTPELSRSAKAPCARQHVTDTYHVLAGEQSTALRHVLAAEQSTELNILLPGTNAACSKT